MSIRFLEARSTTSSSGNCCSLTGDGVVRKNPELPSGMIKRGRVYYSHFRFRGKSIRGRLSPDLSVAKAMLTDLRHRLYRNSIGDISNDYELEKLALEWLRSAAQRLNEKTVLRYEQSLNHVHRLLRGSNVADLNHDVIEDFRGLRLLEKVRNGNVKPQTVNKDVAVLNNMLNWAMERGKIGSNPIAKISKLPEYPKESRALEPEEVEALLRCSTDHWRRIWYAYLASGLRKMELANTLFTDVDCKSQELIVRASYSKNGRQRRVPLDARLFEVMVHQKEKADQRQPGSWADKRITKRIKERFSRRHVFVTTANTPSAATSTVSLRRRAKGRAFQCRRRTAMVKSSKRLLCTARDIPLRAT